MKLSSLLLVVVLALTSFGQACAQDSNQVLINGIFQKIKLASKGLNGDVLKNTKIQLEKRAAQKRVAIADLASNSITVDEAFLNMLTTEYRYDTKTLENMLAFILSHEAAHLILDHEGMSGFGPEALEKGTINHMNELAADKKGLLLGKLAGYEPCDIIRTVFKEMDVYQKGQSKDAVHYPNTTKRIEDLEVACSSCSTTALYYMAANYAMLCNFPQQAQYLYEIALNFNDCRNDSREIHYNLGVLELGKVIEKTSGSTNDLRNVLKSPLFSELATDSRLRIQTGETPKGNEEEEEFINSLLDKSIDHFNEALKRDTAFVKAKLMLGVCHIFRGNCGFYDNMLKSLNRKGVSKEYRGLLMKIKGFHAASPKIINAAEKADICKSLAAIGQNHQNCVFCNDKPEMPQDINGDKTYWGISISDVAPKQWFSYMEDRTPVEASDGVTATSVVHASKNDKAILNDSARANAVLLTIPHKGNSVLSDRFVFLFSGDTPHQSPIGEKKLNVGSSLEEVRGVLGETYMLKTETQTTLIYGKKGKSNHEREGRFMFFNFESGKLKNWAIVGNEY